MRRPYAESEGDAVTAKEKALRDKVVRAAMRRWKWWDKVAPAYPDEGRYLLGKMQEACASLAAHQKRKQHGKHGS